MFGANNARDLDIVRAVLGEKQLNLLGQSYGTYVAAVYGTLFPARLNRSVLDSAINPQWPWREAWRQQAIEQNAVVASDLRMFAEKFPYAWGAKSAVPQACAFNSRKPIEPLVSPRRSGYPQGLVVQGEFDPSTPYAGGVAMAAQVDDRLVTVVRDGQHVPYGDNPCVTATVDAYFLEGTLPPVGARCPGGDPASR
nr:alpha/beta hydrolase [Actinoplanes lichenis]